MRLDHLLSRESECWKQHSTRGRAVERRWKLARVSEKCEEHERREKRKKELIETENLFEDCIVLRDLAKDFSSTLKTAQGKDEASKAYQRTEPLSKGGVRGTGR